MEANSYKGILSLIPGMYVRVPLDIERTDNNFREYRMGQLCTLDEVANTATIRFHGHVDDEQDEVECPLDYLDRCFILPDTACELAHNGQRGRILYRCSDDFLPGTFAEYYMQIADVAGVVRVRESDLLVQRIRQDYDPRAQLLRYEFQQPVWKFPRDRLIEAYSELHNATFGLEELVSARLMLFAHQAEVIARVLANTICRYILADEVGLGKTIEACVILKGLRRRYPRLRVLIIAPSTLVHQWHNEMNSKFWLDLPLIHSDNDVVKASDAPGCILCAEDIATDDALWLEVRKQQWGLLIVDEAHHVVKQPLLYQRVHHLSSEIARVLILSATPIQRYKQEYLSLLALVNPERYQRANFADFAHLLEIQQKLLKRIAILTDILKHEFNPEDFLDELETVLKLLKGDQELFLLSQEIEKQAHQQNGSLETARALLAYLGENYQIERRVIRNRRAHLNIALPVRKLDSSFSYTPGTIEAETLDILYEYLEIYARLFANHPLTAEYVRIWMHASASSPRALLDIVETRLAYLVTPETPSEHEDPQRLLVSGTPRQEYDRIKMVMAQAQIIPEEQAQFIEPLLRMVERWDEQTEAVLTEFGRHGVKASQSASHRLVEVMRAIHAVITSSSTMKVILFSSWLPTLETILPCLRQRYGQQAVVQFTYDLPYDQLQQNVDLFQSRPECRILLCDESGGEGRNFQIADQVIHIDLPWTPTQVEQRIGRIDRIGRIGDVLSLVPFAQGWPEEDLFHLWEDAFRLFTCSMSGMEIALEGVQNDLLNAIRLHPRRGLGQLLQGMKERAEKIREIVEEERYYEEVSINHQLRDEFRNLSEKYRDGKLLQIASLQWANQAGLRIDTSIDDSIIRFNPRRFSMGSIKKAKFLQFPNMEEALRRSGRQRDLVIKGTFHRDIAVRREDLVFFAPGNDPWLDAIIANAIEADIGRSCAIMRHVTGMEGVWRGFELLYSFTVDPRPLYELGADPTHLFRALGFLRTSTYRLLLSEDGRRESLSSTIGRLIQRRPDKARDIHLGQRGGEISRIETFKEQYPPDSWQLTVKRMFLLAEQILSDELDDYMEEVAEEALETFDRQVLGLRFASLWQQQYAGKPSITKEELDMYTYISEALAEGIKRPVRRLESVCYWILRGDNGHEQAL